MRSTIRYYPRSITPAKITENEIVCMALQSRIRDSYPPRLVVDDGIHNEVRLHIERDMVSIDVRHR